MQKDTIQILTPNGFEDFHGINCTEHYSYLKFTFNDGRVRHFTKLHQFLIDGKLVYAKDVVTNASIGPSYTVTNIEHVWNPDGKLFYDPINVGEDHLFSHDGGIISHNSFLGRGKTLISPECLLGLKAQNPLRIENGVKIYRKPVPGHQYVMTVDVAKGRGQDYSTFTVVDTSQKPFRIAATFRDNLVSPLLFPNLIYKYAMIYNEAYVIVENNDAGVVVVNALYYEFEYENMFVESMVKAGGIGVTMTKKIKRIGCSNLKDIVEQHILEVDDENTILELSTFEAKGTSFEASVGNHDDMVMNLVLFAWFLATEMFNEISSVDLKSLLYQERMQRIEDDLPPAGIFGEQPDIPKNLRVEGGLVWETAGW